MPRNLVCSPGADATSRQGKIKYLGLSEVSSKTLRHAHTIYPISAVQLEYSLFPLDIEDPQIDLLNTCKELSVAIKAYSPLGRGFLSGRIECRESGDAGLVDGEVGRCNTDPRDAMDLRRSS